MSSCDKLSGKDKGVLNSIFNPHMPNVDIEEEQQEDTYDGQENEIEMVESRRLETEGVKAAEAGDVITALDLLNSAVTVAPNNPSAYNNRAQVLRLKNDVKGALDDLERAIDLSGGSGKAARQAYVQRGLIRKLEGDNDGSLEDLKKAANLGSDFARSLVVQMNPYAAMCNQMLAEVIGKIQRGEQ